MDESLGLAGTKNRDRPHILFYFLKMVVLGYGLETKYGWQPITTHLQTRSYR